MEREMTTKDEAEFMAWVNDYTYSVQGSYVIDKDEVSGQIIDLQGRENDKGRFVWGRAIVRT